MFVALTEREVFDADLDAVLGEDVLRRAPRLWPRGGGGGHLCAEEVVHRRRLPHAALTQHEDRRVVSAPVGC